MNSIDLYKGINHIIYISSNLEKSHCDICRSAFDTNHHALDSRINHYLKDHQYKILHVGTESDGSSDEAWHNTVAILGK